MNATRAEGAADAIREAILSGKYLSGERLIEIRIAQKLDVSQNTVRDALRILEQEGWVVKQPRRGVYVRTFSAEAAAEIGALLTAVETMALGWAMERFDKADHVDLHKHVAAARKLACAGDQRAAFAELLAFHERIRSAAQHPLTTEVLETLYNQVRLLDALRQARAPRSLRELDERIDDHEALAHLISKGDVEAACQSLREQIEGLSATTSAALRL